MAAPRAAINAMSGEEIQAAQRERGERLEQLGKLLRVGVAADDPQVQAIADQMYQAMTAMWTPDRQAFRQVGEQLATQPDARAMLERIAPGLPTYLGDAYAEYATTRLS